MVKKFLYLDSNATTPVDPQVVEAMTWALKRAPQNPSSIHSLGQEAKKTLSEARKTIASALGVKPTEIVFTSSGTEAMNLLVRGAMPTPEGHIIASRADHACLYQTLLDQESRGVEVTFLGLPTPAEVQKALRPTTKLIALTAVNGETGTLLDIERIAKIAESAQVPLILDGVALLGKGPVPLPPGVLGMGFSAHKFHGPQGVGFAIIRSKLKLSPLLFGGDQERSLRPGTENLPGIVGMAKAITLINHDVYAALTSLRDHFETELKKHLPQIEINTFGPRTSNVSSVYFPGIDNESLIIALDMAGLAASSAAACASGALEPSRALIALGLSKERASCSIRFSFSRMNTSEEIESAVALIASCVGRLSR